MTIIHEQIPAERPGWKVFRWLAVVSLGLIIMLMIVGAFLIPYIIVSEPAEKGSVVWRMGFAVLLFLGYIWFSVTALYHSFLPLVRKGPKRYAVEEQSVLIEFDSGRQVAVPFGAIEKVRFRDSHQLKTRPLWKKMLDPVGAIDESDVPATRSWLKVAFSPASRKKTALPYVFGFSSEKGDILLRRKQGAAIERAIKPWLHHPDSVRDMTLSPEDPTEFFQQLQKAIEEWNKKAQAST